MISRFSKPNKSHFRCCPSLAISVAPAMLAVAMMLQGCSFGMPEVFNDGSGSKKSHESHESPGHIQNSLKIRSAGGNVASSPVITDQIVMNDLSFCDPLIAQESTEFRKEIQRDAPDYYKAVVKAFSLDFVQYPFCLENANHMVHVLEKKMRGDTKYKDLPATRFEKKLNETIKDQYFKNENKWRSMCKGWAEQNKVYQIAHMEMYRKVLGLEESLTDEDLKAQITAFFNWKPWWEFFSSMTKPGCARHYASVCVAPTKVARRHAKELVVQTMGDRADHWFAIGDDFGDDPVEPAIQVGGKDEDGAKTEEDEAKADVDAAEKSDAKTDDDEAGKSVAEKSVAKKSEADARTDEDEAGKSVAEKGDATKSEAEAMKSDAEKSDSKKSVAEKSVAEAKAEEIDAKTAKSEEDAAEKGVAPGSSLQTGQHWRSHHQAPAIPRQNGQHWRAHHQMSIELQAGNQQLRDHHVRQSQ